MYSAINGLCSDPSPTSDNVRISDKFGDVVRLQLRNLIMLGAILNSIKSLDLRIVRGNDQFAAHSSQALSLSMTAIRSEAISDDPVFSEKRSLSEWFRDPIQWTGSNTPHNIHSDSSP